MPWRTMGITMFLSLALSLGAADRRVAAQDKPPADTKAQPRKAADHATEGEDKNQTAANGMSPKQGVVWPGMTRAGTVLLPNGWSLKPAGRQTQARRSAGPDRRASEPSRSWRSFTPATASTRS